MEKYHGVKFTLRHIASSFDTDHRLASLNHWAFILAELGLAPVHTQGAYGNHSYRDKKEKFIITRTGMIPQEECCKEDFCRVCFAENEGVFLVEGCNQPSSESLLHHLIYRQRPDIHCIMHGHSSLLTRYADALCIPVTDKEQPYGTRELAEAAATMAARDICFFQLKNHGFVAIGEDIDATGKMLLTHYARLLPLIPALSKKISFPGDSSCPADFSDIS